ncbi:MAG: hypothetical protein KA978_03175 [Deltaproteobacteria bacterium]|jgi:hypothetical protein|nr:hypothetical protein [Deltaproteobacteria bacterium]
MNPEEVTRTLAMFDAFLSYARAASVPATAVAAHPPLTDVETAVTAVRGSNAAPGSTDDAPSDGDVTRVTAAPPPSAPSGQAWEEPTNERPEVMRALARSDAAQPDTDVSIPLPRPPAADPRVEQASIIIEDDSLTEPEFRREDVLRAMAEHARPRPEEVPAPVATPPQPAPPPPPMAAEDFAAEMLVLVKYGHAAQAVGEVDRWVKAYPEHTNALAPVALSVSRAASRAARRG